MQIVKSKKMIKTLQISLLLVVLSSCASVDANKFERKDYIKDGMCILHSVPLTEEALPIAYGLLAIDQRYHEYHFKYFPNYEPFIPGGCIVLKNAPTRRITKICPKCKEEYFRLKNQFKM
jgi:hypothetical protein